MFFAKKTLEDFSAQREGSGMKRTLSTVDLTFLGIGGIIGSGVFVLTGIGAARYAGPGIVLSFVAAGLLCMLVGLAYAELASLIPAAGSAYAYTFASLGEGMAFLCGWSLIIGYIVTASAVAVGFSAYFSGMMASLGMEIPKALLTTAPEGGIINLPAVIITLLIGGILAHGTKESSRLNAILISLTLCAIVGYIVVTTPHMDIAKNMDPFLPFGAAGIMTGAAVVFFSFMGFDTVATSAEECKTPEKSLPIGIIASVFVCLCIYSVVAFVLTGTVNYTDLDRADPVAYCLRLIGYPGFANLVTVGILFGMITTLIVYIFGQARVFYAMSRDGFLPKAMANIHPKYGTPYFITLVGSVIIAFIAGCVPMLYIVELANTGVLAAFFIVFVGLIALRRNSPDLPRTFTFPMLYVLAPIGMAVCLYLIWALSLVTNITFIVLMVLGYFFYSSYAPSHRCWQRK
ncbi:amino acid permease [Selenomonas sp. oral taxon 920]|uniref:amino acid permease n=1 Tax=Selenomonas sp. oral taxon 920 TaxID=1884263 RepID=UPI000840E4D9|nr:amino acid permease [Selenomonas sp. oral taxon 920]AOH47513.1 amino acid permease [Selenomonas sp. oral taxon 920]